ncbi:MAG TPA: IclR family transcriptional regulator [Bryobacteraceae bacterium]|jgi:IclR family acetate operon transcriptional repressor
MATRPKKNAAIADVTDPHVNVAVLHKAFDVLDLLQSCDDVQSLDEIVAASGLPRSTTHRLLANLTARGYVEKNDAGRYRLGLKLLALGATVRQRHGLRDIVRPFMVDLRDRFGETVNLGCLQGDEVLYLEIVESQHPIRVTGSLGVLDPVHATAIGKSIVAALPSASRPVIRNWKCLTPSTILEQDEFRAELEKTHKRGYALDDEESMEGGRCIGVAILHRGNPVAGLSVSGPISRLTRERIAEMVEALKNASSAISEQLRFFPDRRWNH